METLLVESAIRATLLVGGCAIVLRVARVNAPVVLHAAWAGVVIAMLILPAWTLWGPEARLPMVPQRATAAVTAVAPQFESDVLATPAPIAPVAARPATAEVDARSVSTWRIAGLVIYIAVALILFARLTTGTLRARRLVKASAAGDGHLTSPACASPVTLGWLRPVIILPVSWNEWPAQKLDAVLAHEREHARRLHPFVQWLALLNRALFWFHPAAWWLPRHLSTLAEQACDDAVVARGHDPRDYSRYLVETASAIGPAGRIRLAGVFMPGHQVPQRIRRILTQHPAPRVSRTKTSAIAAACAVMSAVAIVATPAHLASQSAASRLVIRPVQPRVTAPDSPQPVSLEWLEGDEWAFEVQPIASREELAAYGRLANVQERDAFIERFWAQRDPSPGTGVNEFRDEYQRRIAYGRKSFGSGSGVGFDTDRGRIYLMLGAPDSIEQDKTSSDRFEIWRYASIAGLGSDVRMRFSLSRDQYCGLRLVSPAPPQTRGVVGLYPLGLTAIAIPVDARTAVGVRYELRARGGKDVDHGAIGFVEPGDADGPLAGHVPQDWFAGGFGCTHSLPPDTYTLTTAIRRVNGELLRDSVTFDVEGPRPQEPAFEVASVKPNTSTNQLITMGLVGRRLTATNTPLRELIRFAYDVQSDRLVGGPSWLATERFDINALADRDLPAWGPAAPPSDALRMLRKLLADRFGLVAHQETRELPVYALVTARTDGRLGSSLKPSTLDCSKASGPPPQPVDPSQPTCGMRIGPGQMVMGGTAMPLFANVLSSFVGRVVIDRTGLSGTFDSRLSWTPEGLRLGGPGAPPPGAPALPPVDPNGASIFAALQEQLGLKLEPQQAAVDVIVIDRVSRPTPD